MTPADKGFRHQFNSSSVYRSYYFLVYPVGLGCLFGTFCGARGAFSAPYVQLPELFWTIVLALAGIYCFFIPYRMRAFQVYADRVEIRRFTGGLLQTVYRNDITGWHEGFFTGSKVPDWKELSVFHKDGVFVISSSHIENYAAFGVLRKGKRIASAPGLTSATYRVIAACGLAGLGFLAISCGQFREWSVRPTLQTFGAVITEDPVIRKGHRSGHSMNLQIQGEEEFSFHIAGDRFGQFAADEFVEDIRAGDSVFLEVETEEYLGKILRRQLLSFWQKHNNYEIINVYGLSGTRYTYMSRKDAIAATRKHAGLNALVCAGLSIVSFGIGIIIYRAMRRQLRLKQHV